MSISESTTQEWTVATVPRGTAVDIIAIGAEPAGILMVHGVRPGARLVVVSDAPFGGPCIIRVGRSRVAIDRRLANTIRVALAAGDVAADPR